MLRCSPCGVLCGVVAASFLACASPAAEPALQAQVVATGLTQPVFVAHAPGDTSRVFIVEQRGKVKVMTLPANQTLATPFIDVAGLMGTSPDYTLEYGLLGIVFDPDYASNGYFYLNYTTGVSTLADTVVARFRVTADPNVADLNSRTQIIRVPYTGRNHRAGWLAFGPDGFLYMGTGDGTENDTQNNASNINVLQGKILRLDVRGPDGVPGTVDDDDFPTDANRNYRIPPTNPHYNTAGAAKEIWAWGLRNPWRASFDRVTGDLWVGDVGQVAKEEIDRLPPGNSGGFLGWRCLEGTTPTNLTGCPATLPPSVLPVYDYGRAVGSAVIGGHVYRGCAMPELQGRYFFGDWNRKIFSFRFVGGAVTAFREDTASLPLSSTFTSFGEDAFGELYLCRWSGTAGAGAILKIVPVVPSPDANANGIPDSCETRCPADVANGAGIGIPDGGVTIEDLLHYLAIFADGLVAADLDNGSGNGTPDGGVTIEDLLFFLVRFQAGC